jgi:hypothetical protein
MKRHRSQDEIFREVEAWTHGSDDGPHLTPADHYNYYKKMYAQEMVDMRRVMGGDKAITIALQPLRKLWPILEKMQ